jgi:glycerol-3-phosphate O-acyltransferase
MTTHDASQPRPDTLLTLLMNALIGLTFVISRLLLRPFIGAMRYNTVPVDAATGLSLDPSRPVCYVLPLRSWIDLFALNRICRERGLPRPQRAAANLPQAGKAGYLYMPALLEVRLRKTGLTSVLADAAATDDYDVQIVPVSIFWGRDPGQETSLFKLIFSDSVQAGAIRKFLILIANGRNVLANFGVPLSYRAYLQSVDDPVRAERKLTRALHFHFLRARTATLGPTLLRRSVVIRGLLAQPNVREAIEREAKKKGVPLAQAELRARACATEIAADYSAASIRVFERILSRIWNRVFKGVDVHGLDRLREIAQSHEIFYMPSHRSHADYLLLSYTLYNAGLVPPHIAAGINLNFWPVGGFLRKCGAFYMRRKFSGDVLYTAVFRAYVDGLIQRGYSIEFFPEGGRSRTGRLMPPKTGLLAMVVESALRQRVRKVAMVPVYIGYDKVWEVGSYFKELRGGAKQRESAEGLLKATKILGRSYGKAYVSFGEPLIVQDAADAALPGWREAFTAEQPERPPGFAEWVRQLAVDHMRRINAVAVVNPVGLTACALLAAPMRATAEDELVDQIAHLLELLAPWPQSEHLRIPERDAKAALAWSVPIARIQRMTHPWGDLLAASGRDGVLLTYNRNSIQHLFALPALIARLFRTRGVLSEDAVIMGCRALYPFLRTEFFLPWEAADCEAAARAYLERMIASGLLSRGDDGRIARPQVGSPAFASFAALGRLLGETLERHAMAVLLLAEEHRAGLPLQRPKFENDCRLLAERIAVLTGREAPELFDGALFAGYLDTLIKIGVVVENADRQLVMTERVERIAERSIELLSDETRQMLLQLLSRRAPATVAAVAEP